MQLSTWLRNNGKSVAWLAERIDVPYRTAKRYETGERRPRPPQMRRIAEATNGAVTANDFFDLDTDAA